MIRPWMTLPIAKRQYSRSRRAVERTRIPWSSSRSPSSTASTAAWSTMPPIASARVCWSTISQVSPVACRRRSRSFRATPIRAISTDMVDIACSRRACSPIWLTRSTRADGSLSRMNPRSIRMVLHSMSRWSCVLCELTSSFTAGTCLTTSSKSYSLQKSVTAWCTSDSAISMSSVARIFSRTRSTSPRRIPSLIRRTLVSKN